MSLDRHVLKKQTSWWCSEYSKWVVVVPTMLGAAFLSATVVSQGYDLSVFRGEKDHAAPIIRGGDPGGATASSGTSAKLAAAAPAPFGGAGLVPSGGGPGGKFGSVLDWPIIAIHLSLLPDGRVLSYGTGLRGEQGAAVYDIWDPKKGVGPESHTTLTNTSKTNIFCGAGSLIAPGLNNSSSLLTGKYLSLGGDLTVNGVANFSHPDIAVFNPADNSLTKSPNRMAFARWYASMATLANGDKIVLGGQLKPGQGAGTPELYHPPTNSWRTLSGIVSSDMQYNGEWYYPPATLGQDGLVYLLQHNGKIMRLNPTGAGTLTDTAVRMAAGSYFYPRVTLPVRSFVPGYRMLMVRNNRKAQIVDLAKSQPVVNNIATPKWDRKWGNLTVLANGHVLASGGSAVLNELSNIAYQTEIYRPGANTWVSGAAAKIPRLYHSSTLLLPDGSVLTAGGGAPGPLNNLNAEIYYPPYLYNADGSLARRPTIVSAPSTVQVGKSFQLTVGTDDKVFGINLVRLGSQTHSYDPDARFVFAHYSQNGTKVTGFMVNDSKIVLPGYYMLFVVDKDDRPSIAKIVSVQQAVQ